MSPFFSTPKHKHFSQLLLWSEAKPKEEINHLPELFFTGENNIIKENRHYFCLITTHTIFQLTKYTDKAERNSLSCFSFSLSPFTLPLRWWEHPPKYWPSLTWGIFSIRNLRLLFLPLQVSKLWALMTEGSTKSCPYKHQAMAGYEHVMYYQMLKNYLQTFSSLGKTEESHLSS